ncbi:MAG: MotA/TolQ/ExbB proton channel family protein [Dysgonomonas sp.]|jgi:biopolymer transport protein ExbB|uniref:MotA/TolQ/ExbB proton channel family protein n=1 Tax=unclassified Dysgonomonas TaxID=2630389 RepID=UPI0025C1A603|nr:MULTISPECIES: MotA/TolQ/ExbB proton channel family protein [unclassified Dysgonomonas]MDR1715657.1 MotA/TolQ/ExbB proton channel family protein [Prevotella sp.]MDR2002252.1 MotA/TolQ/ExbB proton channel family protein [Prevotella sp.]HMM03336.1 MotA/TolQ/ExbB proton channel family protein [Dysgonomonas sp.]
MNLFVLLQAATPVVEMAEQTAQVAPEESYLSLVMKGGWILLPIFLLSLLAIYVIINKWLVVNRLGKKDSVWLSRVVELIHEGKVDKALKFCVERPYASAKVIAAGLKDFDRDDKEIQESMEVEARQQISILESQMNWLGITASIAPMLGFLGTIFGVIKIFYDIAKTNDLAIDTISTGLYQKMICSGAGLLVGIIAYAGYYVLNGRIDKVVVNIDKESNEVLKAIRAYKRGSVEA